MNARSALLFVLVALLLAPVVPAFAVEGKWTPEQVLELDAAWLRGLGLEIPPARLWGADGAGLLAAAVRISGCTAGFVSPDGLMITNHHCAMSVIQEHSTPERDLLTGGFLATSREEELPARGIRATLPHQTRDVSAEMEAAVPAGADDLARFRALERRQKELVAACEAQPNRRCEVAAFDGGVRYVLYE
ncbi:MAG: S46 family peptidase, partial [Acidobacteria bacterium]|nr:S46 family peptidase [Acidobacteriota bacterium]